MMEFEIDDELLTCFHQPASLSDSISYEDSKLSMSQKMIVSYDLLDVEGKFGVVHMLFFDPYHEINPIE